MQIYLAAIYTNRLELTGRYYAGMNDAEKAARRRCGHILESYHYVHGDAYVRAMRKDGVKVFLDSGAFSAYTLGKPVDLDAYCRYCRDNKDIVLHASVLDGIGDAKLTLDNQKAMERNRVKPLPCFHYGEDEEYLKFYVANYDYITIGGMVPIARPKLKVWLDRIWRDYLADDNGRPKLKVHGFGLTTMSLMLRYPWFSVDSSSWVQVGNVGNVLLPKWNKIIAVSDNSPKRHEAGQHWSTYAPEERDAVLRELSIDGFDPQRLRTEYVARWIYNCNAYVRINERLNRAEKVFDTVQEELL